MKGIVGLVAVIFSFISCTIVKDIQVEMVHVQLVKIDTLVRGAQNVKGLTWESDSRLRFYSIEPLENNLALGTTMGMLIRR